MNAIPVISPAATADQLRATNPRTNHSHGAHFVMTEGNTGKAGASNPGAMQSFASVLAGITGDAAKNLLG